MADIEKMMDDFGRAFNSDWPAHWFSLKTFKARADIVAEFERLAKERDEADHHRRLMLDTDLQMRTLVSMQRDLDQRDARIAELEAALAAREPT